MDFLKNVASSVTKAQESQSSNTSNTNNTNTNSDSNNSNANTTTTASSGGLMGMLSGKLNEVAGGGQKAEAKEDYLDKGIDMFQEKILKQGSQNNESAAEQLKDKMIADTVRSQYKQMTGKDFPGSNKPSN